MTPSPAPPFAASLSLLACLAWAGQDPPGVQDDDRFYTESVRPLLEARCLKCHGGRERIRGGLRLTTREHVLTGGDTGPAVDADDPAASLLLAMISYSDEDHEMPPDGKLEEAEIALLTRWVERGAPFAGESAPIEEPPAEPRKLGRADGLAGWSYAALERPAPPAVRRAEWVTNPIDAFVLARLEEAGLEPAPPAGRVELLRRATYDLTGLPPSPAEVDAFVADDSPEAFARVVEDLLARPQYGEKWGRHWLDLVRYAETNGYERDSNKPFIWRYRDYVIDALNRDVPFDRFALEQLAGDELDEVTPESIVATGYHRLMQWDDEPGQGVLQARYDTLDDLASTTAQAFLGMTIGCARCHDHKGDPITQEDYYSFVAFFHGVTDMRAGGTLKEIFTPDERAERDRIAAERDADLDRLARERRRIEEHLLARLAEQSLAAGRLPGLANLRYRFYRDTWKALPDFDALRAEDEGELPHGFFDLSPATRDDAFGFVFEGELLVPEEGDYRFRVQSDDGSRLTVDGAVVVDNDGLHGLEPAREGVAHLPAGRVPVRLDYFEHNAGQGLKVWWGPAAESDWAYTFDDPGEGWMEPDFDDSAWKRGPGGFGQPGTPGAVVGTQWNTKKIWLRRPFEWRGDTGELAFALHQDDDLDVYVNGVLAARRTGYVTQYIVEEPSAPALSALKDGTNILAVLCVQDFGGQYVDVAPIHRSRIGRGSLTDLAFGRWPLSVEASGEAADIAKRMEARGAEILGQDSFEEWRALGKELERVRKRPVPRKVAFAVEERRDIPQMFVHVRGNAGTRGDPVEPAFPSALNPPEVVLQGPPEGVKSSGRRRALAEWIVSPDNPLTARVLANRLWQHHFGRGIVRSTSDFGELGERPTHPLLLDWLACEVHARGWSLKDMHRLIMSSSAYRMSSRPSAAALRRDPANELFSRFDMRRLTAEEVRDSILQVAGKLSLERGGPSFYSRMPAAALATSSRPDAVWGRSPDDHDRRSIYIKVKRSLVTPLLAAFDFADTDAACPERFVTTQPGQALTLLNSDFMQELSAAFADRLVREAGDDGAAQVRLARELTTSRAPTEAEVAADVALLRELRDDHGLDAHAALEKYCLLTLNLNEFAYLD